MNNKKLIVNASLNTLGVLVYIYLVSLILNNGDRIFGKLASQIIGPMFFLLLFVFSALITSWLILGKPILLYLEGLKKESIRLLFYNGLGLFVLMVIGFIMLMLTK
ncbi:hypothetical protein COT93_00170 [Candidatus Falkowbacteria bacterium CG10_big_fil_rev_8_21_14_0_10_37_18]|uniref:Uncharacterized protein n=1 Tax=Candidatus Falkowbacteria bacterium CG10_big_fil_rev_8_21_14_0_10_37_18 TaxID=1974562 RepID=A0A2H0V9U0_9BACT|nr:MAG: hypothetical protein COT93_00170 [Candidatus Falkowbacteria bacterium CG10_big_fil_rev_8_21_14_0_10_37_18]